jgi:hypothetical protein
MNNDNTQPDSTGQEEANNSVADKLGLNQAGLKGMLDSFLNEEEQSTPALVEQVDESDAAESSEEELDVAEEESNQPEADESSLSKGVQKRINKLVAAKKAAQIELDAQKQTLAQLQSELQSIKDSTPVRQLDVSEFVATLNNPKKVEEEYSKALEVIMWCEDNADGGIIPMPNGMEHELTAAEVRIMKRTAVKRKEVELPQRMAYLQQQIAAESQTVKDFPWYSNPSSEEYQFSQQVIKDFPEIRRRPDWKHVVGLLALGAKTYGEMKTKKPAVPIKRSPVQPSVKAAPAQTSQNELTKARQNFAKNSSDKQGLTDLVKAMGFV